MDHVAGVDPRLSARDRIRAWHAIARRNVAELQVTPIGDDDFHAVSYRMDLGELRVVRLRMSPHEAVRTPVLAAGAGPRPLSIRLQLTGVSRLEQDGRHTMVQPGDVVLSDAARPFTTSNAGDVQFVVLLVPQQVPLRNGRSGLGSLTATRLPVRYPEADMFGSLLRSVSRAHGKLSMGARHFARQSLLDAAELLLGEHSGTEAGSEVFRLRAQEYIEHHLRDPGLDPASVAAALGISVRYLHRAFEDSGTTVAAYARERRLDRARRDLADPACAMLTVTAIAHRWGFTDRSHFSRTFRQAFGTSPGEARTGCTDPHTAVHQESPGR